MHITPLDELIYQKLNSHGKPSYLFNLGGGNILSLSQLDQALFPLDGLIDFTATLSVQSRIDGVQKADLQVLAKVEYNNPERNSNGAWIRSKIIMALREIESIRKAMAEGLLGIKTTVLTPDKWQEVNV